VQSLALVSALSAVACGGLTSGEGSSTGRGSANVTGSGGGSGGSAGTADSGSTVGSGANTVTASGASGAASGALGPASGASAGMTTIGGGTSAGGFTAGSGSGANLGSSPGGPSPCGAGASTAAVSFEAQIMPILQSNCSVGGGGFGAACHADPSVAQPFAPGGTRQWFGPLMPAVTVTGPLSAIYNGFVNKPSTEDRSMPVVKQGDPTQSFLWYKINNTQGALEMGTPDPCARGDLGTCGSVMPLPLFGVTITPLPQVDLDLICNWIVQGAPLSTCPAGQGLIENGTCAPCAMGETTCNGLCAQVQSDVYNCGSCGHGCYDPGFGAYCQNGACIACPPGGGLCGNPSACVNLNTDPNNCGGCGFRCADMLGSPPLCEDGLCTN
jgi:hypothetical protein